jgi:hypothetical protein
MGEFKRTVTTSKNEGTDQTGAQVQQKTQKVDTSASADGASTVSNIIWYIVGAIEILLAFRFVLKLLGANPDSGFVSFIYSLTHIATAPFDNIFKVTSSSSGDVHSVFEPSILVAGIVYALIGWGIVKLVNVKRTDV